MSLDINNEFKEARKYSQLTQNDLNEMVEITKKAIEYVAFSIEKEYNLSKNKKIKELSKAFITEIMIDIFSLLDRFEEENKWIPHDFLYFLQPFIELKYLDKQPSEYADKLLRTSLGENNFRKACKRMLEEK